MTARIAILALPGLSVTFELPAVAAAQLPDASLQSTAPSVPPTSQSNPQPASSPSWYFGGTALFSYTSEGPTACPYICGALGGWTVGGGFYAGGYITRHAGVEGEVSTGTALQAPGSQRIPGYMEGAGRSFTASRRPTTVSVSARAGGDRRHPRKSTIEVVGGVALELASQAQVDGTDTVYQGYGKPLLGVPSPEASNTDTAIGFGGGVDVVQVIRDRLAFTVGGRVYWFARGGEYDGSEIIAFPGPVTMQVRVGLRWLREP
jgi:hypothetical protein